jgi:hypothetical protein
MTGELTSHATPGASIHQIACGWRLELPAGPGGSYRLAQLDDYTRRTRRHFPHRPPFTLELVARVSAETLPGTWGFGLWNDPFGLTFSPAGSMLRLPALPQAAWFFHASPPNWLSLQPGLPGEGFFAGVVHGRSNPAGVLAGLSHAGPGLLQRLASPLHSLATGLVAQEGVELSVDPTQEHGYCLEWRSQGVLFSVDEQTVLETPLQPGAPLGLVTWIDNQFLAWRVDTWPNWGTLENPPAWLEITSLSLQL